VQVAIALQLEDAKGQAHPNSERGPTHQEGKWSDYRINLVCWADLLLDTFAFARPNAYSLKEFREAGKRNEKRKGANKAVLNQDLWQELDQINQQHTISWEWVKGHAAHSENNRCDELANIAPRKQIHSADRQPGQCPLQTPWWVI